MKLTITIDTENKLDKTNLEKLLLLFKNNTDETMMKNSEMVELENMFNCEIVYPEIPGYKSSHKTDKEPSEGQIKWLRANGYNDAVYNAKFADLKIKEIKLKRGEAI